jgi:hypothetical protein
MHVYNFHKNNSWKFSDFLGGGGSRDPKIYVARVLDHYESCIAERHQQNDQFQGSFPRVALRLAIFALERIYIYSSFTGHSHKSLTFRQVNCQL